MFVLHLSIYGFKFDAYSAKTALGAPKVARGKGKASLAIEHSNESSNL